MPRRTDLKKIMLIGSGPIVIGQACEFDYSGTQACKALKEEGIEVVLVNSNPATIMTDPTLADKTYIEPLTTEVLEKIIIKEKPDALLPTLGGQTALNLAIELSKSGFLTQQGVEMIGATQEVIDKAEDRQLFKEVIEGLGYKIPTSKIAYSVEDAKQTALEIGFPCVIRSAFTLGGSGGGIAFNVDEVEKIAASGIEQSRICEILIEQSVLGWKEFELELMRDKNDNVLIICSIENIDPMGVHTGDSMTVAPIQTLSDVEYQYIRDASKDIIRAIGVETGGSNIQFAQNPDTGQFTVIEMNPRVSRSSALASKATGFPIAKIAAKLAIGYTLDEIDNDITQTTPASFEPSIDYCVVKLPRFNFDKFPEAEPVLGVAMKSVGEVMAMGRTFKEALHKASRSLENKRHGLLFDGYTADQTLTDDALLQRLKVPNPNRIYLIAEALRREFSVDSIFEKTKINRWFLNQIKDIVDLAPQINLEKETIFKAKAYGYSDVQIAHLLGCSSDEVLAFRQTHSIFPVYKMVDTCAGEFEAVTPYYYGAYDSEDECREPKKPSVLIIGSGPNRIGQGIEFDYCCVHASYACQSLGYESIMMNSNPETVSTDFDSSDQLFFEPLSLEDVYHVYKRLKPEGIIIQFGGQTPLNLAKSFSKLGMKILGTSWESIDLAEDRDQFNQLLKKLDVLQPESGIAESHQAVREIAESIGFPVLLRPSYVLGGANMEIVYDFSELEAYLQKASFIDAQNPILVDKYLENAIEVDTDALADGKECVIAGIMQHIERAGVHSGDSACVLPAYNLPKSQQDLIVQQTKKIALALNVKGLLNIQFAIKDDQVYVLEVNPRGSRTIPFVSKATGIHWAKLATQVILGHSVASLDIQDQIDLNYYAVKEVVFPFKKFPGEDTILGPQMKSTGEVMGIDKNLGIAFYKSQLAAGQQVPKSGKIFISVKDSDKPLIKDIVERFSALKFDLMATQGTAKLLRDWGYSVEEVLKVSEGRPHIVDALKNKQVALVINTPSGKYPAADEKIIRQVASEFAIPLYTTIEGASALAEALADLQEGYDVNTIQSFNQSKIHS